MVEWIETLTRLALRGSYNEAKGWLTLRNYEMSVLCTPQQEAAYRAHRHVGYCCTPECPPPNAPRAWEGDPGEVCFREWGGVPADECRGVVWVPLPYSLPPRRYRAEVDVPFTHEDAARDGRADARGLTWQDYFGA